jgi:hypothetical protein
MPAYPRPVKPNSIIAQVDGSGMMDDWDTGRAKAVAVIAPATADDAKS